MHLQIMCPLQWTVNENVKKHQVYVTMSDFIGKHQMKGSDDVPFTSVQTQLHAACHFCGKAQYFN